MAERYFRGLGVSTVLLPLLGGGLKTGSGAGRVMFMLRELSADKGAHRKSDQPTGKKEYFDITAARRPVTKLAHLRPDQAN